MLTGNSFYFAHSFKVAEGNGFWEPSLLLYLDSMGPTSLPQSADTPP